MDAKEVVAAAAMNVRRVCLLTLILALAQLTLLARCQEEEEEGGKHLCREKNKSPFSRLRFPWLSYSLFQLMKYCMHMKKAPAFYFKYRKHIFFM